jgi:chitin synthase
MPVPPAVQFPAEYSAQRIQIQQQRRPNDVPIPTTRAPAPPRRQPSSGGNNLRRAKTLVRPERGVAPAPLINPPAPLITGRNNSLPLNNKKPKSSSWDAWTVFSHVITFWAPSFLLSTVGRMKDKPTRQAWREKIALCFLALLMGGTVGFATMGLDRVLCPKSEGFSGSQFASINSSDSQGTVSISGWMFNISHSDTTYFNYFSAARNMSGIDITPYFVRTAAQFTKCAGKTFKAAKDDPCGAPASCPIPQLGPATFSQQHLVNKTSQIGYDWDQVATLKNYLVMDGSVLNFSPYLLQHPTAVANDVVDSAIRQVLFTQSSQGGKDATRLFSRNTELVAAIPCLVERYYAGNIDKTSPGCFIASLFLYISLCIIMGVVLSRFAMACIFNWFISRSLVAPPKNLSRKVISPAVMPEGANLTVDNQNGTAPWAKKGRVGKGAKGAKSRPGQAAASTAPIISMATIGQELFCVALVTCYSEGRDSIKGTLDSLALTNYSDARKLLFIVCDGMITGAGEKQSTPDICVGLLDADPRFGNPTPMGYVAVGLGTKNENRAMVYAGHYGASRQRVAPSILTFGHSGQESSHTNRHHRQVWDRKRSCQRQETGKPR